jgi:hypothetical protein
MTLGPKCFPKIGKYFQVLMFNGIGLENDCEEALKGIMIIYNPGNSNRNMKKNDVSM